MLLQLVSRSSLRLLQIVPRAAQTDLKSCTSSKVAPRVVSGLEGRSKASFALATISESTESFVRRLSNDERVAIATSGAMVPDTGLLLFQSPIASVIFSPTA